MWSTYLLCLLVGLATATSSDYAWKGDTEYQYSVRGRTLASLHQLDNQYSGIVIRAQLTVHAKRANVLLAKLSDTQYAQVHAKLPGGWHSQIPDSQLSFRPMQLANKPFEIQMKNGTVQQLSVHKSIPNWEANFIKSIISQIQVDVQGENMIKSRYNQVNENDNDRSDSISAEYKTMEDSVTGKCETLYDINELPEYLLQDKPELAPLPHLKGDGQFIDIVKSRNYSNCDERIMYHYGLGEMENWEPASASMGDFFLKSSVSRVILSGSLKRHTIQSSVTTNKIVLKPTPNANKRGMVVSQLNITLAHVSPKSGSGHEELNERQDLGNLVYRYNSPYAGNNQARPGNTNSEEHRYDSSDSSSSSSSDEEDRQRQNRRHPRSLDNQQNQFQGRYDDSSSSSSSSSSEESGEQWQQDKPQLAQPPHTPLLPYTVGYQGRSIKNAQSINFVQAAQKLAKEIGQELQKPSDIPKHDTLAKFTILSNLLRNMNYQELQEASRELFNLKDKQEREHSDAWRAYRDAVAQAGTGPALLIVKDWVQNLKIRGWNAAAVVASMAHSARTPTDEYMRTFYAMATDEKVHNERYLNDTAILSFAELVRQVYVDREWSHNEYGVHAFSKFYKQNQEAVHNEYIPYLTKQMKQAIQDGDSHKIQVYIRALGNIGHRHILKSFEPYLEGEKQISQFQRLLMVVSMDQLVKISPQTTRAVLYKIYQNEGEAFEIRVAAVHQLMRTSPPSSMLQRMAHATHFDRSNDVSAAVKSAIQSAAKLQHPVFYELAINAQGALPLLNPKIYGMQFSKQYLKDYVVDQMNLVYKQNAGYIASEDSIIPQAVMYHLTGNMGGLKRQYMNVYAMVSNVNDAVEVLQDQTEDNENDKFPGAKQQSQWASEAIARLLKIRLDEREQLEGNIHYGMGEVKSFYTFDNQTIEQLPETLKKRLQELKNGQEFNVTKFYNPYEMTLSFPTAMGLPFIYTLETPTLVSLHGEVRAITQPAEIVKSGDIQIPETVNITADIRAVVSSKTQAKIGFITPFDHQHYVAGYDKKVQVYLPLSTQIDIDIENQEVSASFEPLDDQNEDILHYSSYPYTAKHDILELKPLSQIASSEVIQIRKPQVFEYEFGKKAGMAFRFKGETEHKFADFEWLYEQYQERQSFANIMAPFTEDSLVYSKLTLKYDNKLSHADFVKFQLGWNQTYFSGKRQEQQDPEFNAMFNKIHDLEDSDDRQQFLLNKAASGINNADAYVYDMSMQFQGKEQHQYNATIAVASSPVDKKSRVVFYYQKDASNEKDHEVCFYAQNKVPNTNGLDFVYALKFDPTINSQMKLAYGEKCQNGGKILLKTKLEQTEERQRYLQSHPMAKQCYEEMKKGNQQLFSCRNMTARANLLDRQSIHIKYENISPEARNWTYQTYSAARYLGYPYISENILEGHGRPKEIEIEVNYEPDFKAVNVSMETENTQTEFNRIRMSPVVHALFTIHPVFRVNERLSGLAQHEVYRPTCVVDKNKVETFDNRTYPIDLGKTWHVQMQYRTRAAGDRQDNKQQNRFQTEEDYDYAILVRDSGNDKKDVKLTLNDNKNYYEIDMTPSDGSSHSGSQPAGKVMVNQQQIKFDSEHSYDIEDKLVQVYALPNGEVKINVNEDFYILYDGERVKLTTVQSDQFRAEVRGLCGNFDGEKVTDFLTPKNCIVRQPQDFVATYAIIDGSAQGPAKERQARAHQAPCFEQEQIFANVISRRDYDQQEQQHERQQGKNHQQSQNHQQSSCSRQQTQYVEEDGGETLCFSVRPLPACREGCKADKKIVKNVEVHCVQRNNVSDLWQKQIQKGASPDFSHKPATKSIKIKVAQSCSP